MSHKPPEVISHPQPLMLPGNNVRTLSVGTLIPHREGITRVSYDFTDIPCPIKGCGQNLQRILDIPGEDVGRPGRRFTVVRCLNCLFEEDLNVRFAADGEPIEVVGDAPGWCLNRFPEIPDLSAVAGMAWNSREIDTQMFGDLTFFGSEPVWLQGGVQSMDCIECGQPMRFLLQIASKIFDPSFREDGTYGGNVNRWKEVLGVDFYMKIEHWSTLYQFECEACRITTSLSECT